MNDEINSTPHFVFSERGNKSCKSCSVFKSTTFFLLILYRACNRAGYSVPYFPQKFRGIVECVLNCGTQRHAFLMVTERRNEKINIDNNSYEFPE